MRLFYTPDIEKTTNSEYLLHEEESTHGVQALRLGVGDTVHLTDGRGTLFRASIVHATPKRCLLQIEERFDHWEERPYHLHLAVAPTKNPNRYEWMVEKVTEVGVDEITPLICARSERKVYKTGRIERIAISAMKQSLKVLLPTIYPATSFDELIKRPFDGIKLIAHCGEGVRKAFYEALATTPPDREILRVLLLIGPEGDFAPDEVALATTKGFQSIHLGTSRLRTETAGVMAAMGVYLKVKNQ